MKKIVMLIGILLCITAICPVLAGPGKGADVYRGAYCLILVPNDPYLLVSTEESQAVFTTNEHGNVICTCRAILPFDAQPPPKTLVLTYATTGIECRLMNSPDSGTIQDVLTKDWQIVVTPAGQVILTCQFH